jgi:hypothetical protein
MCTAAATGEGEPKHEELQVQDLLPLVLAVMAPVGIAILWGWLLEVRDERRLEQKRRQGSLLAGSASKGVQR